MPSPWRRWASRFSNSTWACPRGLDHWTERLIGLTLIVLAIGVVAGILRKDAHGHTHSRIESRLAIAINGVLWMAWRVRRTWNPEAPRPERFQWMYNGKSVFLIGVLHGVGAETPSQLALFFLTANLGGTREECWVWLHSPWAWWP